MNPGGDATGGAERSLALLIAGLVERGVTVGAITLRGGTAASAFAAAGAMLVADGLSAELGTLRRHGGSVAHLAGALRGIPPAVEIATQIMSLATSFGADLLHTNGLRAHVVTPLLSRRLPVVWSLRERPPGWLPRLLVRNCARSAAAIVAPSEFAAGLVSRSRRPVYVCSNPIEVPAATDRLAARAMLRIDQGRPVVSVISHLHPTKGLHVAVDAWKQLPRPRPLLVLAGGDLYGPVSGAYRERLRSQITELDLAADVTLIGLVSDTSLLYAASDVVLQPALYPEGFGRSTAEAQAAGVPVIATAIGATVELIDSNKTGILIEPGDPSAVAKAVSLILTDRSLANQLRIQGLGASNRYRPEAHAAAVHSVYRAVGV